MRILIQLFTVGRIRIWIQLQNNADPSATLVLLFTQMYNIRDRLAAHCFVWFGIPLFINLFRTPVRWPFLHRRSMRSVSSSATWAGRVVHHSRTFILPRQDIG